MANLLVLIEIAGGAVVQSSLEVLGQARRLATSLGATVYALLPLPDAPAYGEHDAMAACARHGADKVVLLTDEALTAESEMRFGTHGRAVLSACEQLPPTLLMMAATPGARDLAPRVAARLGALYVPAGLVSGSTGSLRLYDEAGQPLLDEDGDAVLEHVVVLTVAAGRYDVAEGRDEAEMVIASAPPAPRDFVEERLTLSPGLALVGAASAAQVAVSEAVLVVTAGAPVPPDVCAGVTVALGPAAALDARAHFAVVADDGASAASELLALLDEAAPGEAVTAGGQP